jgi:hypothetical protein
VESAGTVGGITAGAAGLLSGMDGSCEGPV